MTLNRRRRRWQTNPEGGRHFAYAPLSVEEYALVRRKATEAGLTVADYVRRCINSMLLEEGDEGLLLRERRRSTKDEANGAYE